MQDPFNNLLLIQHNASLALLLSLMCDMRGSRRSGSMSVTQHYPLE
jgi:hypothetical protein